MGGSWAGWVWQNQRRGWGRGLKGPLALEAPFGKLGTHTQMGVPWTERQAHILPPPADVGSLLGLGC